MESESCVMPPTGPVQDEDMFKILVSSDNHLGVYDNHNSCRENDSFVTFEEILSIGQRENVDFVLLGGDLFHENRPKPATFQRAVDILQKYTLGAKPAQFEYLGDPSQDFHGQELPCVNYYNPNINIGLPIFTIHGNHDDPIGLKKTSVIDHLAAANLLNHFGSISNLNGFEIRPVLFRKGATCLAIYGLGAMKDQRLYRLMREDKVKFLRPEEEQDSWFNIFVLHQNRVKHGATNYIPEKFIPGFIDLVIWGHEHECIPEPQDVSTGEGGKDVYILQPGSSVVTQLQHGETADKFCFTLQVHLKKFKTTAHRLQTVRPFVMADLLVEDILGAKPPANPVRALQTYCETRVKAMLREATGKLSGHPAQPTLPILRLRLLHSDQTDLFNPLRFSQSFADKVANDDILLFKKKGKAEAIGDMDIADIQDMIMDEAESLDLGSHVEEIVERHFLAERGKGDEGLFLQVLSEKGLSEAVRAAAEKDDGAAIKIVIDAQIEKTMEQMLKRRVTEDTIEEELQAFRDSRVASAEVEHVREVLKGRKLKKSTGAAESEEDEQHDSFMDEQEDDSSAGPSGGRGRAKARGGTTGTGSRAPAARGGRGAPSAARGGRGGKKMVQTTLPVNVKAVYGSKASTSAHQFDSSD